MTQQSYSWSYTWKTLIWEDSCTSAFMAALFTIAMEATEMSIDRWMDKENVVLYIYVEEDIGEGNGTPLQYSCLENPVDGGAW